VKEMVNCPCCGSDSIEEAQHSPENKYDGQGYWWAVVYGYWCEDCGCEFNWKEETTKSLEIEEHGKECDCVK